MFGNKGTLADVEPDVKTEVKEVTPPAPKDELGAYDVVFGGQFGENTEHNVFTFRVLSTSHNQAVFDAATWVITMIQEGQVPDAFNDMTLFDAMTGGNPLTIAGVRKVLGLTRAREIAKELGL